MKRAATVTALAVGMTLLIAGCAPVGYMHHVRARPAIADSVSQVTVPDVVAMSKAGVTDTLIVAMIYSSGSVFFLNPQDVIDLKSAGVSENVINAMIKSSESIETAEASDSYYRPYYYPYVYPPNYWYAGYSWYPSLYWGFSSAWHRPWFVTRFVTPRFGFGVFHGTRGGHVGGGFRTGGRHR